MKQFFRKALCVVFISVLLVGSLTVADINAEATSNKDYSDFRWYDGYNMTIEDIIEWGNSHSNGKTEDENYATKAEFTAYYLDISETKSTMTLCIWRKDKDNSGPLLTLARMDEAATNAQYANEQSIDEVLESMVGSGIWKDYAKKNKYVQKFSEYTSTIAQLSAVVDAYTANRIKYYFVFEKNKKGNISEGSKPIFVYCTYLYENHEKEAKNHENVPLTSKALTFADTGKPVYYRAASNICVEGGLYYWLFALDPKNYRE